MHTWVKDIVDPETRSWEEFYRNRWQYDRKVRSTHGVNCTGGCSWDVHVKEGIVTWEMQALDYPKLESGIPPYEPRGCQRGISFSWYLYSPIRVKYPYMRGTLLDLWETYLKKHSDPVEAWAALQSNAADRALYQGARGKGGFRRVSWEQAIQLIAAANIYTVKKWGADRIVGFSPIPAMSMVSYAAGARFLQLLGGVSMSFYDWYCDLPPASPEIWGEQTDVAESADWFHSKYIAVVGSNLNMTRTPDSHFLVEGRHNGSKVVVMSPDFSQISKHGDWWIPIHAGQDGAFWMAVNHVILKEFHADKTTPYFEKYLKQYSDLPFLVELTSAGAHYKPGKMIRAGEIEKYQEVENKDWKFLMWDAATGAPKMPKGSIGFRWQSKPGEWNLELKDGLDESEIVPTLSLKTPQTQVVEIEIDDFAGAQKVQRFVPARILETLSGKKTVTTIYDLIMATYGVARGLHASDQSSYDDETRLYTPAWQEKLTGISRATVIQFAREWAGTAEATSGKCCVIIGAGVNHWYHNNLIYRAAIHALMLTGCVGKNGGGLNHYVGQEKLAPQAPWASVAFGKDWIPPSRLQNSPSFHYVHSNQWRYEGAFTDYNPVPSEHVAQMRHTIDHNVSAVRMGHLPFYPQYNKNTFEIVKDAVAEGSTSDEDIKKYVVSQLKNKNLKLSIEDPDAPENWPRLWYIWRGNAIGSSAKGHEFFLKHYLGTHHQSIAAEVAREHVSEVVWHEKAPEGKMDLIVDLNFRMDTSALYSDVVLPAATWYEKDDLNSTDMHSFIHPLSEAVPPTWESKSDWDIFQTIAKKTSELAEVHLPEPLKEFINVPLLHDTADEISQSQILDWGRGECEPIPGKTMFKMAFVERDYVNLYRRFISLGPALRKNGVEAHGIKMDVSDFYDELVQRRATETWNGQTYPSLKVAKDVANAILHLAPETNGEVAFRAYQYEQHHVGLPLTPLAEKSRAVRLTFEDLQAQPRRLLNSPVWSGLMEDGRTYSAYCYNTEHLVPWRTLTGRQHFYLDHAAYIQFGEHLPTYKPTPPAKVLRDLNETQKQDSPSHFKTLELNLLTPHGKWHIHSTYSENHRMMTLSRGCSPIWINDADATLVGISDNDWIEVYNDNGVVVTRAIVSARTPRGVCLMYHAPERTVGVAKAPVRGTKRGGIHNSLTRTRLKPNLMAGGYGQFTYSFNYWGPTGVNRETVVLLRKINKPEW